MFIPKSHLQLFCLPACFASVLACGAQDSQGSQGQTVDPITEETPEETPADAGARPTTGDAVHGAVIAQDQACGSCHVSNYAGTGFYPNITPDEVTGIGAWSDQEIADAIAEGIDVNGETLCVAMPRATLSRSDLDDLIAYLRSLPAVDNEVSKVCPGHGR
jgi:mono/diheme cytochrome c family protein